jgi:hypothetical protein
MDLISTAMNWTYQLIATWYGAAIIGGALILAIERLDKRREPSEADVQQAADRYREWYGDEATTKIGDHMLAASFAPDGRHSRFLKRVSEVMQETLDHDRAQEI